MAGEPSGGTVGVDLGNWTVAGSMGVYGGAIVGGAAAQVRMNPHWSLKAGDQNIEVGIPTEVDFSSGILSRGATLTYTPNAATRISLFGGMAGGGYASTNVLFFTPQIPLGSLSIDHYLDPKKRIQVFARALFSNQQTILGGVLYQTKRLQTGFAAGTGSNQPHAEGLLRYVDQQWDIHGGYLYSGRRFQLLTLPQFKYAQQDRENVDLRWSPKKELSLSLERHQYLEPVSTSGSDNAERGSTDMAGGTLSLRGFRAGGDAFESRFTGIYASAASFYVAQRLTNTLHVNGNYYLPLHSLNPIPMLTLNAEQNLNRRLKLAEFATHSNGQWNVNYGGDMQWDRFDVNVGYSTYFAPLAPGGGRFKQEMNLSGHVNLGRWQFGVQTYVQPDGSLLYAYQVRSFYFHPTANGTIQAPQSRGTAGLAAFLIVGQVKLESTGAPIANVPVRIGDETVYTDDAGVFSFRASHKRPYKIQLVLGHQIGSHYYEQVNGPVEVMAGSDAAPGRATFVVRVNPKRGAAMPKGGIVIGSPNPTTTGESLSSDPTQTPAHP